MMKIVASLVILGLCANVCFGAAPSSSAQSGAFAASVLNSTATKVVSGSNTTDAAVWDSSTANSSTVAATSAGVPYYLAWFGPGATNDTSYLWGIPSSAVSFSATTFASTITSIRKRTINNTIAGNSSDSTEASVLGDTSISTTIPGEPTPGIGPGYIAFLSTGLDGVSVTNNNQQVWYTLVSGSGSATTTKLTSVSDVTGTSASLTVGCTVTSFTAGNIWYDIGTGAFFFTYAKNVVTQTANTTGVCSGVTNTQTTTVYLQGMFPNNGTAFWTSGPLMVSAANANNMIDGLMAGGDNTLAASNIWIVYKDYSSGSLTTYVSKTAISNTTTAVGAFSALVKDTSSGTAATTLTTVTYVPAAVWSSNFTYAITLSATTTIAVAASGSTKASTASTYGYTNFFNGTTTGVDSGFSGVTAGALAGFWGWQLSTGYTIVVGYESTATTPVATYTIGTFYANGTVNGTQTTAGTLTYGTPQFYEDVNGTQWVGWFDVDVATGNSEWVYNAYLAKFQGQLNIAFGANVFATLSIVAVFLASIFIF